MVKKNRLRIRTIFRPVFHSFVNLKNIHVKEFENFDLIDYIWINVFFRLVVP